MLKGWFALLEKTGLANFSVLVEFLIEILFVEAPQLALSIGFLLESLFVGAPPQLAVLVEFLIEILFVEAPGLVLSSVLLKY
ncbi:hypothetical protein HMPREF3225_00487 [Staphylococcus lugdunensis]|uniref:Uncharacterized protein n=1 Tax=Staphylococcus lugdunensis TaxID=28035 RepID=A0ABD4EI64_STALU|nr:hypothetical protein HMPREF3225_00487 [Staphylococcus lugdunensis]